MKLILALVVLAGFVQNNEAISWTPGGDGQPGSLGVDVQFPGGQLPWGGAGAGGGAQVNLEIEVSIPNLNTIIGEARRRGLTVVVEVLQRAIETRNVRLGAIIAELRVAGAQLPKDFLQWVRANTGISLSLEIELGPVDTEKVAQQAINSVKKLLKLAQGILVSVLKQLADFLKQYLPQIADTLVSLLNAALPPYVDALVGCTQPILDLVGMLIAECPKDPEVENSTTGGSTPGGPKGPSGPRPGGPSGPGGPELPPFPVGGGPPTPVISSVQETDTPAGPGGDPQP